MPASPSLAPSPRRTPWRAFLTWYASLSPARFATYFVLHTLLVAFLTSLSFPLPGETMAPGPVLDLSQRVEGPGLLPSSDRSHLLLLTVDTVHPPLASLVLPFLTSLPRSFASPHPTTPVPLSPIDPPLDDVSMDTAKANARMVAGTFLQATRYLALLDQHTLALQVSPHTALPPFPDPPSPRPLPSDIQMHTDVVEGPSGGLMLSLALIDYSEPGVLSSHVVAGTGTVDAQGRVGAVGGVAYKVQAALAAGAEVFFVPRTQLQEALLAAQGLSSRMVVVPVDDYLDALSWLCHHGASDASCRSSILSYAR